MEHNLRLDRVQPSAIRTVDTQMSAVPGIIKFTMGEPDFAMPENIKAAMKMAIDNDESHYAPSQGIPELCEAIVNYYQKYYDMSLNQEQILVTAGASESISVAFLSLLNEGDQVLIPSPYFTHYDLSVILGGGEAITVDTSDSNFILTAETLEQQLQENPAIKILLLNYPNNPLGTTYTKPQIQELAKVVKKHDIAVISDEIYADLTYDGEHYSIYNEIPDQTILIAGASKSFAMTGIRIGFIHANKELSTQFFKTHQAFMTCVASPNQYAAVEAYNHSHNAMLEMKAEYAKRRDLIYKRFNEMGLEVSEMAGAFYAFPRIPKQYGNDDLQFALDLAEEAKVGVIPGQFFGPGGEGHFRLSYASSFENIVEAMARFEKFLKELD